MRARQSVQLGSIIPVWCRNMNGRSFGQSPEDKAQSENMPCKATQGMYYVGVAHRMRCRGERGRSAETEETFTES